MGADGLGESGVCLLGGDDEDVLFAWSGVGEWDEGTEEAEEVEAGGEDYGGGGETTEDAGDGDKEEVDEEGCGVTDAQAYCCKGSETSNKGYGPQKVENMA